MEVSSSAYADAVTIRPVPEPVQYLWWLFVLGISISSLCHLPVSKVTIVAMISLVLLVVLTKAHVTSQHHSSIVSVTIGSNGRIEMQLAADARLHVLANTELSDRDETDRKISVPSPTLYRAGVLILIGLYHRSGGTWTVCHSAGITPEQRKRLRLFLQDPQFAPVLCPARQHDAATGV